MLTRDPAPMWRTMFVSCVALAVSVPHGSAMAGGAGHPDLGPLLRAVNSVEWSPSEGQTGHDAFMAYRNALAKAVGGAALAELLGTKPATWPRDLWAIVLRGYVAAAHGRYAASLAKALDSDPENGARLLIRAAKDLGIPVEKAKGRLVFGRRKGPRRSQPVHAMALLSKTTPRTWNPAGIAAVLAALAAFRDAGLTPDPTPMLTVVTGKLPKGERHGNGQGPPRFFVGSRFPIVVGESGTLVVKVKSMAPGQAPQEGTPGFKVLAFGAKDGTVTVKLDPHRTPIRRATSVVRRAGHRLAGGTLQLDDPGDGSLVLTFHDLDLQRVASFLAEELGLFPDAAGVAVEFCGTYLQPDASGLGIETGVAPKGIDLPAPRVAISSLELDQRSTSLEFQIGWPSGAGDLEAVRGKVVAAIESHWQGKRYSVSIHGIGPHLLDGGSGLVARLARAWEEATGRDAAPLYLPYPTPAKFMGPMPGFGPKAGDGPMDVAKAAQIYVTAFLGH